MIKVNARNGAKNVGCLPLVGLMCSELRKYVDKWGDLGMND